MSMQRAGGLLLGSLMLATAAGAQSTRDRTSESTAASQAAAGHPAHGPDLARVERMPAAGWGREG